MLVIVEAQFDSRLCKDFGMQVFTPERAGDVRHSLADISRAEKHLGYRPKVAFEDGLSRTIEWYRSQEKAAGA